MSRESDIEEKIREYALSKGCRCYKLRGPGDVGKPDRVMTCNGWTVYIEVKTPQGRLSTAQIREHARIANAGGLVYTVDSLEAGKRIIDHLCG